MGRWMGQAAARCGAGGMGPAGDGQVPLLGAGQVGPGDGWMGQAAAVFIEEMHYPYDYITHTLLTAA